MTGTSEIGDVSRGAPTRRRTARPSPRLLLLVAVAVASSMRAGAEEPAIPAALRTAAKHASLAVAAEKLPDVRAHLHHVLNCLEGPQGQDYDAKGGDPCGGKGALEALPAGSANRARAQKAIELAKVGVTFHDFKPAHDTALAVQAVLEETSSAKVEARPAPPRR